MCLELAFCLHLLGRNYRPLEEYTEKLSPIYPFGNRESVRLEGKRRFDRGLFILDVEHMPSGCGVWPAWWLTDEEAWPG